jgi:hypothetical protein
MLSVINAFKTAHRLTDVTVVADAGMVSETNQAALQAAGLSFILGTKIPFVPDVVRRWRDTHPGHDIADGQIFTQPWPATSAKKARGIPDRVVYYKYRHDRTRRTLRGIDEQVAKAQRAVDGKAPVKRNRFTQLTGATKSVNRDLAGLKGYTTNLTSVTPEFPSIWRPPTTLNTRDQPPAEFPHHEVSGLTGAVHIAALTRIDTSDSERPNWGFIVGLRVWS